MDAMTVMALGALLLSSTAWLAIPSAVVTLLHGYDEVFGGEQAPLWEWAGVRVPWPVGFAAVGVGLPALLAWSAWAGYAGGSGFWLGVLCGARLGDAAFSHALPSLSRRGNPGLSTAPLLLIEGVALAVYGVEWLPAVATSAGFAATAGVAAVFRKVG